MACEMIDRGLDQRLAIGPRDQRAWADRQLDRPEGAGAGDIGDGLMGEAAREERGKSGRGGIVEMTEQKPFARESERVRSQSFGVETGGCGVRGEGGGGGGGARPDNNTP